MGKQRPFHRPPRPGRITAPSRSSGAAHALLEPSRHQGCTLFDACLAPLCPLDQASLKGIWYPDEEICRSRSQGGRSWIRSQRRIVKVAGHSAGYFTKDDF